MATTFDRAAYEEHLTQRIESAKTSSTLAKITAHELADVREDSYGLQGRLDSVENRLVAIEDWMCKLDQRMEESDKRYERIFEWMQKHP